MGEYDASMHVYDDSSRRLPHRAEALADLMSVLPPEERPKPADEAQVAINSLPASAATFRARFLTLLAASAPEDERKSLVSEALAVSSTINDVFDNLRWNWPVVTGRPAATAKQCATSIV